MSTLTVEGVSKRFHAVQALDDLSFEVADGEFFCVVGPSNAGKSTLLKTVAGLERPDLGRVAIGGRDVRNVAPKDRNVSLLFQNIALFPTLTGYENIAFPLRTAGMADADIRRRVHEIADVLKIAHVLDRYPRTFSGGEQQRAAIGRAIARPCDLLMLDEPLSNLDARIRVALRIEFKKLHRDLRQTMLYVTHDQIEAMSLSDRIAVLRAGKLQQVGTPDEIYHRPVNRFVAQFVGTPPMNILDAELAPEAGMHVLAGNGFEVAAPDLRRLEGPSKLPRRLGLGVRAEDIRVAPSPGPETPFPGAVLWVERLGSKNILDMRLGDVTVKVVVAPDHPVHAQGPAWLGFVARHVLDRESGAFLR